jgi:LysM repeat protein
MNNPNPFVPKGSILEAQSKRRSRLKIAVFCSLAVGVAGLSAMLIQGCKREQPPADDTITPQIDTNTTPVVDTNTTPVVDTNTTPVPPVATNTTPYVPPVAAAGSEYAVLKGDTLAIIAKKNGVTLKALELANPGVVPTKLKIGYKLTIPAPTASAVVPTAAAGADTGAEIYIVKSGDTLSKIAKAHGTTAKAIQSENNLPTTVIKVGAKLKMPVKAEAAAPAPVAPEPAPVAPAPVAPMTPPPGTTVVH